MKFKMKVAVFLLATTIVPSAGAITLDPKSVSKRWVVTDLMKDPGARLLKPGARMSLVFPGARGQPDRATVFVLRSRVLTERWPDSVAAWSDRLLGHQGVSIARPATLTTVDGRRTYRVETRSDAKDVGTQLHTALLVTEMVKDGQTRLLIFSYEDVVEVFDDGLPLVTRLFDVIRPLAAD